jgi:hypothetical protein
VPACLPRLPGLPGLPAVAAQRAQRHSRPCLLAHLPALPAWCLWQTRVLQCHRCNTQAPPLSPSSVVTNDADVHNTLGWARNGKHRLRGATDREPTRRASPARLQAATMPELVLAMPVRAGLAVPATASTVPTQPAHLLA